MITVSPPMRRKAEALAERVPLFSRGRDKTTGIQFVIVPGSAPNVGHRTNGLGCTCRGYEIRGLCTHQLAVQIHQQRQEAPRIEAAQQNCAEFGQCVSKGCIAAAVNKGRRCRPCLNRVVRQLGVADL
jgi:hypothetical protein